MQLAVPRAAHGADRGCALRQSPTSRRTTSPSTAASRTTSVPRTLLDLATRYHRRALLRALAEAEFQHDLRPADIDAHAPPRPPRQRQPASRAARATRPATARSRAGSSARFRRLLIEPADRAPLRNEPVGPWTVDCLWPDRRVAVELDGRQHERPRQADSDDDRDLWLRRHGYVTRRYGKRQIDEQPDDVIADLLDAFAQPNARTRRPVRRRVRASTPAAGRRSSRPAGRGR